MKALVIKQLLLALVLMLGNNVLAERPEVIRVDPPHWWVGFSNSSLEILVSGKGLTPKVELEAEGVEIVKIIQPENKNYLRVILEIAPSAQAQELVFTFYNGSKKTKFNYQLKARNYSNKGLMGLNPADFVYLITPDRFANGNPANDVVSGMNEQTVDRNHAYKRHGGDIAGIIEKLDYLKSLGVTALWINPLIENNQPEFSYHGYAMTDHYKIDARFGSNEEYRTLVNEMHKRGLKMVMDVVYNHWGNEHYLHKDLPDSTMENQWDEFTKTNYRATTLHDPHASSSEKKLMTDGWFDTHMPDINQRNPIASAYLIQNSIWWIEEFGIDCYRIDTYAYCDQDFMSLLAERIAKEYPQFFMFGETWVHGIQVQNYFVEDNPFRKPFNSNLQSVTDFQWYFSIEKGIHEKTEWNNGISRIYYTLAADYMYKKPEELVTFVDNHDIARWYGHCGEDMTKFKIGIGLILTSRGIPSLYYGTEILMKATNGHGEIREDFWGGWPSDSVNKFTAEGRNALENEAFDYIEKLANYRKNSEALTWGELTQYSPKDGVYSFIRHAKNGDKVLVLVNNQKDAAPILDMKRYAELIPVGAKVRNLENGREFQITEEMLVEYGIGILQVLE